MVSFLSQFTMIRSTDAKEIQVKTKGKLSLAHPEASVELLMILVSVTVQNILNKALAHFQSKQTN